MYEFEAIPGVFTFTEKDFASSNFRPVQIDNMHTGTRVQHKRYEPEELARWEDHRRETLERRAVK